MTTFEIVRDLILLGIALFGAGLSLFNYADARRREQRTLRTTLSSAIPTYGDTLGSTFVKVTATNTGARSVVVVSLGLELEDGARLASLDVDPFPGVADDRFPKTLADGDQASVHMAYHEIGRSLLSQRGPAPIRLYPVAESSDGKKHRGKPWVVTPDEWASHQ